MVRMARRVAEADLAQRKTGRTPVDEGETMEQAQMEDPGWEPRRKSSLVRAAKLSLLCPLPALIILIAFVLTLGDRGIIHGRIVQFYLVLGLSFLISSAGIILGIRTLRGIQSGGGIGIRTRAILGILFNFCVALPVLIATAATIRGVAEMGAVRELAAEQEAARFQTHLRPGEDLEKVLIAYADRAFVERSLELLKQYRAASSFLTNGALLDMGLAPSLEELLRREALVREYLEAGRKMQKFVQEGHLLYAEELEQHKISATTRAACLREFDRKADKQRDEVIKLRQVDLDFGKAELAALSWLENHWGKWDYVPATKGLRFNPQTLQKEFEPLATNTRKAVLELVREENRLRLRENLP